MDASDTIPKIWATIKKLLKICQILIYGELKFFENLVLSYEFHRKNYFPRIINQIYTLPH